MFLTVVKGLNASEISFLTTISVISAIVFQPIALKVIKKIGNTNSIRLGAFLFFISAILLTFCNSLAWLAIGKIIYENSFVFKNMNHVALRKNLKYENREHEYAKEYSKGNIIFSIVTALVALIASSLFTFNNYLPMYICIFISFICFVASFFLFVTYE